VELRVMCPVCRMLQHLWNYGREIVENFAESGDFHVTFGFFYMP